MNKITIKIQDLFDLIDNLKINNPQWLSDHWFNTSLFLLKEKILEINE